MEWRCIKYYIYLNFMRSNPPFDPRMQPMPVYMGTGPQPYMQAMVHPNAAKPPNYQPMAPNLQPQQYPIHHPPPQLHPQYANEQVRIQRQEPATLPPQPTQVQAPKPLAQPAKTLVPMPANANQSGYANQSGHINQSGNQSANSGHQEYYQNQGGQEEGDYGQDQQQGPYQEGYEQGYPGEQQGEGEQQQQMKNQQIIMFWQHKFYTILQRFQLIFQKVQWIRSEFYSLNNELKNVDSEEEWNEAKQHHEDFMEQLEEFSQELAGVISENANLVEQNENQHNEHNIWKERYFQLFEGYKAMEQQMSEMKQGKLGSGQGNAQIVDQQKYSELVYNYKELEREYSQVTNQLAELKQKNNKGSTPDSSVQKIYRDKLEFAIQQAQKYKETLDQFHKENQQLTMINEELKVQKHNLQMMLESNSQRNHQQNYEQFNRAINERDQEINLLNKELKELSEKYNYLVETHNSLQSLRQEEEPRIKSKFTEIQQQINAKNVELMELKGKIHQLQLKQKSNLSVSEEYQKLLKIRTSELQQRSDQILKLRKELVATTNLRRNESDKDLGLLRRQYDTRIKKVEQEYEDKIDGLKKKLRMKEEEVENTALLNIKVESLEKKNKMLLVEIENLNNDLSSRDKESIELKRLGNLGQKLKDLEHQYHNALHEKQHLASTLAERNHDIQAMQSQINNFESRIKSLSQSTQTKSINSKPLMNEIEQLSKIIQLKDNQINKLKSSLNLKDGNIRDLENQVERIKGTIIANEKLASREKDALNESNRALERKNQQNEKKMRQLQYQFGSIMKRNLQDQIRNLRSQNQLKQQNIIRLEAEELELRSRISHYERIRGTHNTDIEELTTRIKELETSKFDMIRKVQNSFRDVKTKERQNRQLVQSAKSLKQNISKLQLKISQNEKLLSQKDQIIQNIQGQLLVANSRLSYISQEHDSLRQRRREETDILMKQSDDLRRKIFEYEHMTGSRKEFKDKFSSEITKIENQMIQQLKEEKEFLKSELAVALQQIGNIPTHDTNKSLKKSKIKASEGIDYIQKRLFDFNGRLDQIIAKNKQIGSRGFGSNIENSRVSGFGRQQQSQQQIKALKNQIQQLRKYISKLEVQAAGEIRYNPKNQVIELEQQKINNERMEFYQNQANQLQERIQSLIKVNTNLKQRIDSLLRDGGNGSAVQFYKSQLAISEETIQSLHIKIRKIMEENRTLKSSTNDNTSKMCREYEDKLFEAQNKIFSLQRKVSALQLERNKVENSKADLQRTLNLTQTELQSIKYSSQKQLDTQKRNGKQLADQVIKFQNEIADLLQKVRILQSENSRLSQAVHSSYSQQHIFMNTPVKDIITPKAGSGRGR